MNTDTIVIIFSNMAMTIAIIGIILSTKKDIHKLEIEIIRLQHRISVLETRFDVLDENQISLENQIIEVKTENKNYIKELTNKVIDVFPKSAL